MHSYMKAAKVAKNMVVGAFEPLEQLSNNVAKPIANETFSQLFGKDFGFFGENGLSSHPTEVGRAELEHARKEKHLKDAKHEDSNHSAENVQRIKQKIQQEYIAYDQKVNQEQRQLHESVMEMQSEVVKLAQTAGVETNIHVENKPKKLGIIDIKRLTAIIKSLRLKADSAKSGSELVNQRQGAKRGGTGMEAWISGKQMKIHEQGTMQLQG